MRLGLIVAAAVLLPTALPAASRSYSVTSYDRIRLEGPFEVTVHTGVGSSARAEAEDPRMLDRVRVEILGRTLVIRRDQDAQPGSLRGIRIVTTTPALSGVAVLGAGTIRIDAAKAPRFDVNVSGAGGVEIAALTAEAVVVSASGAGHATLAGHARQVRGIIQGVGAIDAAALAADDVTVTTAGAGTASFAAGRTAKVTATGSGSITIIGQPACTVATEGTVDVACAGPPRQ